MDGAYQHTLAAEGGREKGRIREEQGVRGKNSGHRVVDEWGGERVKG